MDQTIQKAESDNPPPHKLYDNWTLWAHLPHDTDWSFKSYKEILTFNTAEETITLCSSLPEDLIVNSMLFLMRKDIKPMWEDKQNKEGGCFSYRIQNKSVKKIWKQLSYSLVGETLTKNIKHRPLINGIGISPKKNFCVIKIWLSNCSIRDPEIINPITGLPSHGCLFKKHIIS